jgi:predicted Fe-S protein YdhL (DUF1289 family)
VLDGRQKTACIKKCKLNQNNICISCNRHINEIIACGKAKKGVNSGSIGTTEYHEKLAENKEQI